MFKDVAWGRINLGYTVVLLLGLAVSAHAQEVRQEAPQIPSPWDFFWQSPKQPENPPCPIDLGPPVAEQSPWGNTGFAVDVGTWISWGKSQQNIAGPGVDVLSDLKWRNMMNEILEVNASGHVGRFVVKVDGGVGAALSSGQFEDQDFSISGRQGLYSDTLHSINSLSPYYGSAEVGWRCCDGAIFKVDGLVGYFYWREKYVAEGGVQLINPENYSPFPPGPVVSEQFTWQAFQLGFQEILEFAPNLYFKTRVMLLPYVNYDMKDIHYLRTDLQKDPSVEEKADGGFGVTADFRFLYCVWKNLYLELGYRVWDVQSGHGGDITHLINGTNLNTPLNRGETFRQGLTLGLCAQF